MQSNTNSAPTNSGSAGPASTPAGADSLTKSAHSGIDAASKAVHPAIDRLASGAHNAVDNADGVADQAAQAFDKASAKGEQLAAAGTSYMREHPLVTIGLAITAGYVLSRLTAKR